MAFRVTKVNAFSLAKMLGVLQAALGFVTGVLFSLLAISKIALMEANDAVPETLFGVWSFLFLPVLNGVIGFISGWLVAWMYNSFSSILGGVEIDLEK